MNVRSMWEALFTAGLLCFTGCPPSYPSYDAELSDFEEMHVWTRASDSRLTVSLSDALATSNEECPRLTSEAEVDIDGVPIPMSREGGGTHVGPFCEDTVFSLDAEGFPPAADINTITIADDSLTVVVAIANLLAERTLTLVSHPDGEMMVGDEVVITMTPDTDSNIANRISFRVEEEGTPPVDEEDWESPNRVILEDVEVDGTTFTFIVPPLEPEVGSWCLFANEKSEPQIVTCDGIETCRSTYRLPSPFCVPATIVD